MKRAAAAEVEEASRSLSLSLSRMYARREEQHSSSSRRRARDYEESKTCVSLAPVSCCRRLLLHLLRVCVSILVFAE